MKLEVDVVEETINRDHDLSPHMPTKLYGPFSQNTSAQKTHVPKH